MTASKRTEDGSVSIAELTLSDGSSFLVVISDEEIFVIPITADV